MIHQNLFIPLMGFTSLLYGKNTATLVDHMITDTLYMNRDTFQGWGEMIMPYHDQALST